MMVENDTFLNGNSNSSSSNSNSNSSSSNSNNNNNNCSPFNVCDFNLLPFSNDWPSSSGGGFALDVIIVSPEQQQEEEEEGEEDEQEEQQLAIALEKNDSEKIDNNDNHNDGYNNEKHKSQRGEGYGGIIASSDFFVEFPDFQQRQKHKQKQQQQQKMMCAKEEGDDNDEEEYIVLIQINNVMVDPSILSMSLQKTQRYITNPTSSANQNGNGNRNDTTSTTHSSSPSSAPTPPPSSPKVKMSKKQQFVFDQGKSTKPSTQVLRQLVQHGIIKPGRNVIQFILASYKKPKPKPNTPRKQPHRTDITTGSEEEEKVTTLISTTVEVAEPTSNKISYRPLSTATAFIYSWGVNDKIVVVDIDGTVTKSDVRGVVSSIITEKYDHVHCGVCAFFSNLVNHKYNTHNNNYNKEGRKRKAQVVGGAEITTLEQYTQEEEKEENQASLGEIRVMYLSSRSIKLMNSTRKFLSQLSQFPDSSKDTNINPVIEYMTCLKPQSGDIDIEKEYDFCQENDESNHMIRSTSSTKVDIEGKSNVNNTNQLPALKISSGAELYGNKNPQDSFEMIDKAKRLPQGPILLHTGSISTVLVMELIKKSAYKYKADTLIRQVVLPFLAAGKKKEGRNSGEENNIDAKYDSLGIFLAGFGNKKTDAMAYEMAGLRQQDIYIINKNSEIVSADHDTAMEGEQSSLNSASRDMNESKDHEVDVGCFDFRPKPNMDQVIDNNASSTHSITTVYRPKNNRLTKKLTFSGYDDPQLTDAVLNKNGKTSV